MVFANLTEEDKEAFFALLDEYFASRPELARVLGLPVNEPDIASRVSSVKAKASSFSAAASNPEIANAVGRVAAASLAFSAASTSGSGPNANATPSPSAGLRPAPPLRRPSASSTSSTAHDRTASEPPRPPPPRAPPRPSAGPPSSITTQRKLGDLDTSSAKNMFWGMRKDAAPPPSVPVPAALPKPKAASFAPPPVRRGTVPAPPVRARTPTPEPEPEPEQEEEEEQDEWAEALYDYNSSDPNDLPLRENQRVLVTARTSDDWWTGEADGKSGLFPATYVKIL